MTLPAARAGLYFFLGSDRAQKRQRVRELGHALAVHQVDWHSLHAAELSAATLSSLLRAPAMMGPTRLVVIDEAQRLDGLCLKILTQAVPTLAPHGVILLIHEELPSAHPLAALRSQAVVQRFEEPATVGASGRFALVEALATREASAVLQALHEQLMAGKDVLELVGLIVWQLHRWLTVQHLVESGTSRERIGELTRLQSWQLERVLRELAGWSTTALQQALWRCWELDRAAKRGALANPRAALEGWLVEVCLPRPMENAGRGRFAPTGLPTGKRLTRPEPDAALTA